MTTATLDPMALTPGMFSGYADLRRIGPYRWKLSTELVYVTLAGLMIRVPAGFETDGASVPRPLWWLYPALGGNYTEAAIVHDYLYQYAEGYGNISRASVDAIFREAMDVMNCREGQRKALWLGVRAGGWVPWRKYRKAAR